MALTKSQVNKLGKRLAAGEPTEADLQLLEEFLRTYTEPYESVRDGLLELGLEPSGRLPKTRQSIAAKVLRESTRLWTMQDMAGWRIVVGTCPEQDQAVALICGRFEGAEPKDLRNRPSHGYRAVHVIVSIGGKPVEIRVRTQWQNKWAMLSEKLADWFGHEVKYGGGPPVIQGPLESLSVGGAEAEGLELELASMSQDHPDHEGLDGRLGSIRMNLEAAVSGILRELP